MLNINKTIENGKAAFSLEGRLDTVSAPELEAELKDALDGVSELTLDLEKLEYISSAGLRVLLAAYKQMKASGGDVKLSNVGENFRDVLENTGLDAVFGA